MAGWGDSTLTPLSRPPAPHPRALRRVIPPPRHLHRRNPGHQPAHPAAWGAVLTPRAASPRVSLLLLLVLVRFTPRPRAKAVRELEDRPRSASCVDLGHLEIPGIAKLLSEVKPSRDAFQLFLRARWRHRAGGRSQRTERDLAAGAASAACGACNGVAGVPSPPEC